MCCCTEVSTFSHPDLTNTSIPRPPHHHAQLVNATYPDLITPRRSITDAPFWIPSQSLQLKMMTRAHALLEVLNQVRAVVLLLLGAWCWFVLWQPTNQPTNQPIVCAG